jgi:hypothetical protein
MGWYQNNALLMEKEFKIFSFFIFRALQHGLRPSRVLRVRPLRVQRRLARRPLQHQDLRQQVLCSRILRKRNLPLHKR